MAALRVARTAPCHNLPTPLTSFIGRERDLAEVERLLDTARLLTLVGPPGIGKTRLALQVAADLLDAYPDGVWLVELAALADPTLVAQTVATTLGVREQIGQPLLETLSGYLRSRRVLLLLDNCEHLVEAAARAADILLRACPDLRVLATSREALGIPGEVVWPVPPLSLPTGTDDRRRACPERSEGTDDSPSGVARAEAVRLFVERATAAAPSFALAEHNAAVVARICERLDGVPLAIELAAARVRMLGVEQIAARLDDRFRLLTSGSRTAPRHQQTLRAAVDSSYELLSSDERWLFDRLAVFAGGWTLEAAEAVCAGEGLKAGDVLETLGRLVDKSLVTVEAHRHTTARYGLLETLRQYARDRLAERGEAESVHQRHAAYYLALAEEGELKLRGAEQAVWLDRLEIELDNVRAALRWLAAREDAEASELRLRLAGALWFFCFLRGHVTEGLGWLEPLLASPAAAARTAGRAKALHAAGFLASSRDRLEEGLAIQRELGDRPGVARSLVGLGVVANVREGDPAGARALFEEALVQARELGERWTEAWALTFLAGLVAREGDATRARSLYEESLAAWRELGDRQGMAYALHGLGDVVRAQGNSADAKVLYQESLTICRQVGDRPNVATTLASLGHAALDGGDYETARDCFEESLAIGREIGELADQATARGSSARSLQGLADLAMATGDWRRAVRLAGAAAARRERTGMTAPPDQQAELERRLEPARRALGEEAYSAAWAEGRAMDFERAIDYALTLETTGAAVASMPRSTPEPTPSAGRLLTRRERDVAVFLARGWSNRQIAEQLVISERTVEGHVANILSKLGFESRTQVAIWAVEHGLVPTVAG